MAEVGKVHVHSREGGSVGYVRVDTDQIGNVIGEVYTSEADRIGAIRHEPMKYEPKESLIYNQEGARIAFVRLVRDADGRLEGTVNVLRAAGTEAEAYAYLHQDMLKEDNFVMRRKDAEGEAMGWLEPEGVSDEFAILMGGGAGLLLLTE